jgi:hypothetical protein
MEFDAPESLVDQNVTFELWNEDEAKRLLGVGTMNASDYSKKEKVCRVVYAILKML